MEELSRMGTEPWLGKGVSNGGSQHDGMAGRPLPGWVTVCCVKHRTNPMTNTRIKLATLAMIHLVCFFEHVSWQAMTTLSGECLPTPQGSEP